MGTTLTGTTPQDTYDSLIKVTDNGPLSGSLKTLTDGLGNDSALALSTGGASVTGTLAVSGNAAFDTNTLFVDAASNEVGIGTASPQSIFHIGAAAPANAGAKAYTGLASTAEGFLFDYYYDTNASNLRLFDIVSLGFATTGIGGSALRFLTVPQTTTNTPLERMRITSAGNVGIGTSSPTQKLSVVDGSIFTSRTDSSENIIISDGTTNSSIQQVTHLYLNSGGNSSTFGDVIFRTKNSYTEMARFTQNGLTFNGDTAAANALDDYEEGSWTMGISFGGASTGVTYSSNTGTYTKIGRKVTVNGYLVLTSKGSSTGVATLEGLPFTIPFNTPFYSAASYWLSNVSFANQFQGNGSINTTRISFDEITEAGVTSAMDDTNFANNSAVIVSFTYFV